MVFCLSFVHYEERTKIRIGVRLQQIAYCTRISDQSQRFPSTSYHLLVTAACAASYTHCNAYQYAVSARTSRNRSKWNAYQSKAFEIMTRSRIFTTPSPLRSGESLPKALARITKSRIFTTPSPLRSAGLSDLTVLSLGSIKL